MWQATEFDERQTLGSQITIEGHASSLLSQLSHSARGSAT